MHPLLAPANAATRSAGGQRRTSGRSTCPDADSGGPLSSECDCGRREDPARRPPIPAGRGWLAQEWAGRWRKLAWRSRARVPPQRNQGSSQLSRNTSTNPRERQVRYATPAVKQHSFRLPRAPWVQKLQQIDDAANRGRQKVAFRRALNRQWRRLGKGTVPSHAPSHESGHERGPSPLAPPERSAPSRPWGSQPAAQRAAHR